MRNTRRLLVSASCALVVCLPSAHAQCSEGISSAQLKDLSQSIQLNRPYLKEVAGLANRDGRPEVARAASFLYSWSDTFAEYLEAETPNDPDAVCLNLSSQKTQAFLDDFVGLTILRRHAPLSYSTDWSKY